MAAASDPGSGLQEPLLLPVIRVVGEGHAGGKSTTALVATVLLAKTILGAGGSGWGGCVPGCSLGCGGKVWGSLQLQMPGMPPPDCIPIHKLIRALHLCWCFLLDHSSFGLHCPWVWCVQVQAWPPFQRVLPCLASCAQQASYSSWDT